MSTRENSLPKRIMCLVGTRPECIKMVPVIRALRAETWASVDVVSTGQHRDLVHQILSRFSIPLDHDLDVMQHNQSLGALSSRIFSKLDALLEEKRYDLVVVQGDTTSVMIAALAAFYRRIPVAHVEAGLRTNDLSKPFPEELNRRVAGLVAGIHFAPTASARENLLIERVPRESIHVTGNTVIDTLMDVARGLESSRVVQQGESGRRLILVTAHRRENFGEPVRSICDAIRELHDRYSDIEFVYPVHPNPNIAGPVNDNLGDLERVSLMPPLDYEALVAMMMRSHIVLTDSGGIQEEAPALGKPVLVLRDETERPEAVDAGVARLVGCDKWRIVQSVEELLSDEAAYARMAQGRSPYGDGKAGPRIARLCKVMLCGEAALAESMAV